MEKSFQLFRKDRNGCCGWIHSGAEHEVLIGLCWGQPLLIGPALVDRKLQEVAQVQEVTLPSVLAWGKGRQMLQRLCVEEAVAIFWCAPLLAQPCQCLGDFVALLTVEG